MGEASPAALQRRFTVALGAAVLACALFTGLLTSSLPAETREAISVAGLIVGGVAVVLSCARAAVRAQVPRRRRSFMLLASAAALGILANLWFAANRNGSATEPGFLRDGSIALGMLVSIAGLLQLPSVRQRGEKLVLMVLDGLIMGGAALVIVSILVYGPVLVSLAKLESPVEKLTAHTVWLFLPLLDVALATVALLLIMRSKEARGLFLLIGAGFLLYAVSDLAYAVKSAELLFEYQFGTFRDMGWIAGYLLFAAAAWHPDAATPAQERNVEPTSDVLDTVLVFGILLTALGVQLWRHDNPMTATQTGLWLLFVLAVGIRQSLLTADNANLRHGLEHRVREQTADLRRMAHRTETLLRSVGDGIYGVDLEGRVSFLNPSGALALGYDAEALLGANAHERFHAPQVDGTPFPADGCYVTEAIRHGFVSSAEEDVYVRADGSTFPVEITSSPLVDDDRVSGAVVVFRDVTQRQEVDRMKNEFLSVVSHELRTPLTSIRGSLGLVASGSLVELTPQAERMVSIAVESSERLTRLINDILDIERIQSGKLPMNLTPHAAGHLLEATATEMSGLAAMADVRLEVSSTPGRVLADADRMVQALTNLVGNAVKYAPAGSVVRLEAVADESRMTFAVHDEGRGIPADKLESVFEPFEQVDSTDARQKGGTGLGLSICRGIVERHGGRIWAESSPDTGTTVRFTLPMVRSLGSADDGPAIDAPVVLVCDADADTVTSLSAMLGRHGYRPVAVSDGSDVLARAATSRPAAVLLGTAPHGTSRAEILGRLQTLERTRSIPVITVVDPGADPAAAHESPVGGANGRLLKPVTEERLVATVTAVLEGRRHQAGVLIVEDDEDLAGVLRVLLSSRGLDVVHVASVAEAVARARVMRPQVVVLDLGLPDGDGWEVVARLREEGALGETAVVVYSADDVLDEHADGHDDTIVFLTKARVTPEALEDQVLRLIGATTGTTMGGDLESASSIRS